MFDDTALVMLKPGEASLTGAGSSLLGSLSVIGSVSVQPKGPAPVLLSGHSHSAQHKGIQEPNEVWEGNGNAVQPAID